MAACCEEAEARLSAAHSGDSSARAVDDERHHALQNGKVIVTADSVPVAPLQELSASTALSYGAAVVQCVADAIGLIQRDSDPARQARHLSLVKVHVPAGAACAAAGQ